MFIREKYLPRVKGLEMIDPSSAVVDKRVFQPISKSTTNLDHISSKKKQILSKSILKQKEQYWSTDQHVEYVPFQKDYFLPPIPPKQKDVKSKTTTDLDSPEKRAKTPSREDQKLQSQKSKKRVIIDLDQRFQTKVRASVLKPPRLSSANLHDHNKESDHDQKIAQIAENAENNLSNEEDDSEGSDTEKKEKKGVSSINDISSVRFADTPNQTHTKSLTTLKSGSSKTKFRRDVVEVSHMYLKNPNDIQEIIDRKNMFKEIKKGNKKRAKTLEQKRIENMNRVMREKPQFFGREYYYNQMRNQNQLDDDFDQEDANNFYTYDDSKVPFRSAMTMGTKKKAMMRPFQNMKLIKRFQRALRIYKIVTLFWKAIDDAIMKKRQIKLDTFQVNLKDSIQHCMKFTLQCGQTGFLRLFKETDNLSYYLQAKGKQMYIDKMAGLRQHCLNIMTEISRKSANVEKDTSFIKLIAKNANNYEFPPQNFWPAFIVKRVEFTKIGSLKNIKSSQKEMIALLFFVIYGIFNRLVRPWTTLKLEQSDILAKNSQLVLSILFYILHDYLKEKNPIIAGNLKGVDTKYYLKERNIPLNAYPELLANESSHNLNQAPDENKQKMKMDEQVKSNDNIIIGICSRRKLVELVDQDNEFKTIIRQCYSQIAYNLLSKADLVYPEIKDKILNLAEK